MKKHFYSAILSTLIFTVFLLVPVLSTNAQSQQNQIDQMAGVLQSLQNIFDQLKQKVTSIINSRTQTTQAATETIGLIRQDCVPATLIVTPLSPPGNRLMGA